MGINFNKTKLMLEAKRNGASFDKILTLGHQKNNMVFSEIKKLKKNYHILGNEINISDFKYRSYMDKFFNLFLGVKEIDVIDYSDYEGANIVHDLNLPIPDDLNSRYDVVIDGGTLEHIFNFPVAIKNCMKMTKVGGSIFIFSMSNNHCGHGFYQFSPELFFRIFDSENGFEVKKLIINEHPFPGAELSKKSIGYEVVDPKEIGRRINIVNNKPLGIMVHAKKIKDMEIFTKFPYQSDYSQAWNKKNAKHKKERLYKRIVKKILNKFPLTIKNYFYGKIQLYQSSISNHRKHFKIWK